MGNNGRIKVKPYQCIRIVHLKARIHSVQNLEQDLEIDVYRWFPSNLTDLQLFFQRTSSLFFNFLSAFHVKRSVFKLLIYFRSYKQLCQRFFSITKDVDDILTLVF